MLKRVESAECETIRRIQKFAVRTVARHPGNLQGILRRKPQSALHRNGHRPARSENSAGLTFACVGQKLRETAIDARDEGLPGFHAVNLQFSVDPHSDNGIEESLEVSAALGRTVCGFNRGIEITDL